MILVWRRQNNCTERVKKSEELKLKLTAVQVQIQLSEKQGFTDKQKSFCSLSLTTKPMFFCDTLMYQSRFKCQIIKDLFHNTPLKSKLKNFCCPPTNIMRMNRTICMIPELARIYWKTFPFFGRTS